MVALQFSIQIVISVIICLDYTRSAATTSKPDEEDVFEQVNCHDSVKNPEKKKSFLTSRFSASKLEVMCKKETTWELRSREPIKVGRARSGAGLPTPDQSKFINEIKTCRGKACFSARKVVEGPLPESNYTGNASEINISSRTRTYKSKGVVRKEYRALTDKERQKFHSALRALKTNKIDGVSKYDLIVSYHLPPLSPEAHFGCAFVPWHREYLKQLEVALRWEVPDAFLPYWDSTLDEGLPNPCDSVMWSDDFMGNSRGKVTKGPFADWTTTKPLRGNNDTGIHRNCGLNPNGDLFQPGDLDYFMTKNNFSEIFCHCEDATLETGHGLVHVYVGGHLSDITLSPNDPVFFMHHAFIDYIWEQWRLEKQTPERRENEYPPDNSTCRIDANINAPLTPFPQLTVKDGLSNIYADELYTYQKSPRCPKTCTGPNVFCSTQSKTARCLSKIKPGGDCTGFDEYKDACYKGKCVDNKCV